MAAHPPLAPGVYSRAKRARGAGGRGRGRGREREETREGEDERERTRETTLLGHIGGLQSARARSEQHGAVKPGPLHLVRCVPCGSCGLRRGECTLERDFLAVVRQNLARQAAGAAGCAAAAAAGALATPAAGAPAPAPACANALNEEVKARERAVGTLSTLP